ncbi:DUF6077 domain-containing protein [Actinomadura sp. HBU206391]|uniref:DUF6077 domain-containing protein n=1 Tax=Actinomadura sp. HBU206391 TaxID=2731692 RepID=UPI00165094A1|nr:DUF6077 domain-containing protein [Actinomadura sp. HBU206391]MBC6456873.1 hypothetical protein [Actinomadura sp. HBU206391]
MKTETPEREPVVGIAHSRDGSGRLTGLVERLGRGGGPARATAFLDGATDAAVVAFAAWTAVYHAGLLIRPPTAVLVAAWLVVMATLAAVRMTRGTTDRARSPRGTATPPARATGVDPIAGGRTRTYARWAGPVLGVAAGVAAGLYRSGVPWWITCVLGAAAVAVTLTALRGSRYRPDTAPVADRGSLPALVSVLVTAAGFAGASLFVVNPDGDDAYFMSRSVWTAEHGRIPFRDVIFTPGSVGTVGGEPPIASVEVFNGALARLLGIAASSFTWYLFLPVVTFLAVWAMWRLIRLWAPRRAAACFATAAVYLLWTGAGTGSFGSFHLIRMWQGKGVLVSLAVPLLYVYLTRWAEHRSRRDLWLAVAVGAAATGLASAATFVVPLVTVAAVGPLLLRAGLDTGRQRVEGLRTALAACAAMAYPVVGGVMVALFSDTVEVGGRLSPAPVSYSIVLLTGVLGVIAGCALWTAPWISRRGVPALVTAGVAAIATVLFVPGVLELMADATGAAPVLWRTMWSVPAAALIGLLAALPLPGALRRLSPLPAVLLCAAFVICGTPLWTAGGRSVVAELPSWKASRSSLITARAVVAATGGASGAVLMPDRYMRNVPLITSRVQAVNANPHYLMNLPVGRSFIADRRLLTAVVGRSTRPAPVTDVRAALDRVGVVIACAQAHNDIGLRVLQDAGYVRPVHIHGLVCLFPPARPSERAADTPATGGGPASAGFG